jgi:RecJ-like exonuclease
VDRVNAANDTVVKIRDIKSKIDAANKGTTRKDTIRMGEDLKKELSAVEEELYQVRNRSGQDPLNYPIKLNNRLAGLIGVVQSGNFRPTDQSYEVFARLSATRSSKGEISAPTTHGSRAKASNRSRLWTPL